MNFLFFIIFLLIGLYYVWNGKDYFSKREWLFFIMKFVIIYIGAFALVLLLTGLRKIFPVISKEAGGELVVFIPLSLMTVLALKFLVVMMNVMFSFIMKFHQRYNTSENYSKLASLSNRFGSRLLILLKCVVSFAGFIVFYGIWFGMTI